MRNYCTLADSNYRVKLLALYASMMKHIAGGFHLYILCLDDPLYGLLSLLKLENVTLIRHKDFLDPALAAREEGRTYIEWTWTKTPSLPLYVLMNYPKKREGQPEIHEIAYVDADLFFFSDPQPMYDEIGDANSMVIPHRFPPGRDKSLNGKYNVSLVWWRNSGGDTLAHLREWRQQCLDWCFYWHSNGRFADQGYLDDWPEKWGSHVLQHLGCNLAPWNMGQYHYAFLDIPQPGEQPEIVIYPTEKKERGYKLIFFHFHEFKINNELTADFFRCNYARPAFVDKHIYPAYEDALRKEIERIRPHVTGTR